MTMCQSLQYYLWDYSHFRIHNKRGATVQNVPCSRYSRKSKSKCELEVPHKVLVQVWYKPWLFTVHCLKHKMSPSLPPNSRHIYFFSTGRTLPVTQQHASLLQGRGSKAGLVIYYVKIWYSTRRGIFIFPQNSCWSPNSNCNDMLR